MAESGRVLLVDDDTTAAHLMQGLLSEKGYTVDVANSVSDAEKRLKAVSYHVTVSDIMMPERSGMDLLQLGLNLWPEMPIILITGHGTIRNAVEALRMGAYEYIPKPVQIDELVLAISKALDHRSLVKQNVFLKEELDKSLGFMYRTSNDRLQRIYDTIELLRGEETSVLLHGETGTGKEVIARLIHNTGSRSAASFVPINCGAIPEHLIESELFGYEKGAFTGALKRTPGKLEIADQGTLFLDEINELSQKAQVALLRFLQDREVFALGSHRRVVVDVQVITATNKDLRRLVEEGRFREDLYYRINVLPLHLPPLRERKEDILDLALWFLTGIRSISTRRAEGFTGAAKEAMFEYHWPGNIRELRNCIDRASLICRDPMIDVDSLFLPPPSGRQSEVNAAGTSAGSGPEPKIGQVLNPGFDHLGVRPLREVEDAYIEWVLQQMDGNRTRAAAALGVSTRGLRYRLNQGSPDP